MRAALKFMRSMENRNAVIKEIRRHPGSLQLALFGQRCVTDPRGVASGAAGLKRRGKKQGREKALFSNIPEIAWVKDREGRFVSASASFAEACGVAHGDLIGKTDWDIWPCELAERYEEQDRELLKSGLPCRSTFNAAREAARGRWQETVKTPLFGADGQVLGTLGITRDISAHKQAAAHLRLMARQVIRARENEKKRISSFLHDELGSLIMLINSSLALAQQEALEKNTARAAARLEEAKKVAHELAAALRKLCFDIRPPAMGVTGLAGAVVELAARAQRCTGLKTQCAIRLPEEKKIDELVKILVYRIIQESLSNAVKHSGARAVKIGLNCGAGRLKFYVEDDGKGFDAEDPKFLKRHPTLGLRIMREEALSLFASLSVESTPGFGTVVKGDFPLNPGPVEE